MTVEDDLNRMAASLLPGASIQQSSAEIRRLRAALSAMEKDRDEWQELATELAAPFDGFGRECQCSRCVAVRAVATKSKLAGAS